ncbi:MAG: UvrB/UvrC motif-containing protein [Oscillospiraceae bacterium]|jgi:protein arginine kinase activator|nr:UvrB/UvrC motif-containing protein [Oscillospiraceae bacterium]
MAKCEHCHENEAEFHKHTDTNGHIEEIHLCLDCAEKLGYTHFGSFGSPNMYDLLISEFSRGILRPRFLSFLQQDPTAEEIPANRAVTPLDSAPPSIPFAVDPEIARTREINVLRAKMRDAAEREDFETAMDLREQIKQMEVATYE